MGTYLKLSCILPNTYEYFYFQFSIGNMYEEKKILYRIIFIYWCTDYGSVAVRKCKRNHNHFLMITIIFILGPPQLGGEWLPRYKTQKLHYPDI